MKIKNLELLSAQNFLSNLKIPATIAVDSILGIIDLTSKVKEFYSKFVEATTKLMEAYELEPKEDGSYTWAGHEKEAEIRTKYDELAQKEHELTMEDLNKEPNLYTKFAVGLSVAEVLFLKKLFED